VGDEPVRVGISSGLRQVKVYPDGGGVPSLAGVGVFARAFMERFPQLPVEDDGRLNDPALRERFIERLLAVARRRSLRCNGGSAGNLSQSRLACRRDGTSGDGHETADGRAKMAIDTDPGSGLTHNT